MTNSLTVNSRTYSDDSNPTTGLAGGGHRTRLLPMFGDSLLEIGAQVGNVLGFGTRYLFDAATSAADPGRGSLRLNHAAAASATLIHVDNLNSAGNDVSGWLALIGANKGHLHLRNASGSKWRVYAVNGATANAGYCTLAVTHAAGVGADFTSAETLILSLAPAGPAGGMAGAADGVITAPGLSFANEPGLGVRRKAAGVAAVTAAGADLLELRPATLAEAQAGTNALALMTPFLAAAVSGVNVKRVARTANTPLAATDNGRYVDVTANSFTQTFAACAALGAGWSILLGNSGAGDVTLDPNGAETIDGLTSFVMYPGELRVILCDGAQLITRVLNPFYRVFTASGVFVKPPGYSAFGGLMWSGGSSGAKASDQFVAGGNGGGCLPFVAPAASLAASTTVTVGAGGAPCTVKTRNAGGATLFGALTVYGATDTRGGGASASSGAASPGLGPLGGGESGAYASYYGGGFVEHNTVLGSGSNTVWGGAPGGIAFSSGFTNAGGTSVFGGAGGNITNSAGGTVNGLPGAAPGGGGGATSTGAQSGAGGRGELRIWGVC